MTKEEAVQCLQQLKYKFDQMCFFGNEWNEVFDMASSALLRQECEDAVSRREVIDFVNSITNLDPKAKGSIVLSVKFMKPVTPKPKTGKWIEHSFSEDGRDRLIECSECGAAYVVNCLCDYSIFVEERKYCNKCGAKMNGSEQE